MPRQQTNAVERVAIKTLIFCGITIATFMASSLVGHVMVEKSRVEGLAALSRYREAEKATNALQDEVDALANVESVRAWAFEHGFRMPGDVPKSLPENALVATR